MHVEEDSDEELLFGWRSGAAYAAAMRMESSHQQQQTTLPVMASSNQQQQTTLPYKQKKAASSSDSGATKMITKTLHTANGLDKKQKTEVVDLGSDSDEDIHPSYTFKIDGKVDKPRELMQRRSVLEKSISLGDGGMVGTISSRTSAAAAAFQISDPPPRQDDASSSRVVAFTKLEFPAIVHKPGEAGPSSVAACDDLLASICGLGMRPNITAECSKQLDQTQVVLRKGVQPMDDRVLEESRRRSPGQQMFVDLTCDDDGCDSEPEWLRNHEPAILPAILRRSQNNEGSGVCSLRVEQHLQSYVPTVGTSGENIEVGNGGADQTRMILSIPGLESPENRRPKSSIRADVESEEEHLAEEKPRRKRGRPAATAQARDTLDDRTNLDNLASKKSSRARRGPLSEEELAAQEAEKQRKRDLKEEEKRAKEEKKEEEKRAKEEKKEELKRQKEAAKAQEVERKKVEKLNDKLRKGKNALKNTTVHLDMKVLEKKMGSLILQQLSAKEYNYTVVSNPIESTIVWTMKLPASDPQTGIEEDGSQPEDAMNSQLTNSQVALVEVEVKYVVVVLEGQEFSRKVSERTLDAHISSVRQQYPTYTICYVINGLKKYIKDLENHHYKLGAGWEPPPVYQALAEFVTHRTGVRYRLCIDAAEIADHIIGLTRGHAEVPFKQKLTSISVHTNGDHVTKSECYKDIIKKNTWLKFLVAIPNIPGSTAIAIAKEYPTMRALLDEYFSPFKTTHEKEFLLAKIVKDIPLGSSSEAGRHVGPVHSKRIYRVLTAQDGNLRTEDAEDGADHFTPVA